MSAAAAVRAVSLVPSVTETLRAWGVIPVGVTRFCDAPGVERVGGTKNPDIEAIVALAPDVVVMDREENRAEDAAALEGRGVRVHALHVRSLADVQRELNVLANVVGHEAPTPGPAAASGELSEPAPSGIAVRAFVPIWRRPWMTISAATYGSSLLAAAGIANVYHDAGEPYPETTLEEAGARGPTAVLAPSEPYPFRERHRAELEVVAPVVLVDGQDLFWWGHRTPGALVRLRELAATLPGGQVSPDPTIATTGHTGRTERWQDR